MSITSTRRFVCTKEDSYTPEKAKPFDGRSWHPDAVEVDCGCDCCARFKCPNCGTSWKEELPQ